MRFRNEWVIQHPMSALALVTLFLTLPITHFNSSEQQRAFRPYGFYFIQDQVPKGFQNVDTIQYWLPQRETSGPDDTPRLAGVNLVGGIRYRFSTITVNRKNFSFVTKKVRGVHYSFTGRFLRTNFLNDELNEERAVARGTIVRYKNDIKVAQATITLSYWSGT